MRIRVFAASRTHLRSSLHSDLHCTVMYLKIKVADTSFKYLYSNGTILPLFVTVVHATIMVSNQSLANKSQSFS